MAFLLSLLPIKPIFTALVKLIGGCILVWIVGRLGRGIAARVTRRTRSTTDDFLIKALFDAVIPLAWMGVVLWSWETIPYEGIGDTAVSWVTTLVTVVVVVRAVNRVANRLLLRFMQRLDSSNGMQMLDMLQPMVRVLFWTIGLVSYLQAIGVGLGVLWALLSAGGIGAGLALREPVAEFFEYITILLDKPFEKGDLVNADHLWAKVEKVGIRSTRLRSLNGELVVMSNSMLTSQPLSNYAAMQRRRRLYRFGVTYDTSPALMEAIPAMARTVVEATEDAEFDRCHFVEFGSSSLDFELCYFIPTGDYVRAMDAQQRVNLGIMKIFARNGIDFAFPTRTLYLHNQSSTATNDGATAPA